MKSIEAYFVRERRRIKFYRFLHLAARSALLCLFIQQLFLFSNLWFEGIKSARGFLPLLPYFFAILAILSIVALVFISVRNFLPLTYSRVGEAIERQIGFLSSRKNRGEIRSAGSFLDQPDLAGSSREFRDAHILYWNKRFGKFARALLPSKLLVAEILLVTILGFASSEIYKNKTQSLPSRLVEWTPSQFEIKWPYEGAPWRTELGALSGIQGSDVRFPAPKFGIWQSFLYVKETGKAWTMIPCQEFCELKLQERGRYAIGSLFSRSSFFPLQVIPDEVPHGILFAKVNDEFVPSAILEAVNQEKIPMQFSASDDVRLVKIELIHRLPDAFQTEEKIISWNVDETHARKYFSLAMNGWKGGSHHVFLRMYDQFKSSDSPSVTILFADEETMRAKRMSDLRGLIDEWVHILADLLESDQDQKLSTTLLNRIRDQQALDIRDSSLVVAYIKELSFLGERIEKWAKYSPDFSQIKDLVQRTEKEILYGLSLLFQEKTGEIEATSDSLKSSQNQLQDLLDKIKKGELNPSSAELDEAFKKLAEQLEALQKKIRDLPSGPNDELMNREALDAQVDESETLAKKIEDIKKQMAGGDNAGAMRELESLLNQLSILSKEMERSLDQWKTNLDQGSMQSAQRFAKKLEELKKKQEALAKKTDVVKEKAQKLEAQNSKTWQPIQPEKQEALKKEFNELKKEQEKVSKEFRQSAKDFDKETQGSEFEPLFRSEEAKQLEEQIADRMEKSKDALGEQKGFDSLANQKEAIELIKKAMENQQKMQEQLKSEQSRSNGKADGEKLELLANESKGGKDRRRKIMESLQHKVDERFQKSHEQYFEEQLQR